MFAALALLFLVVPFVELYLLIQVGQTIGALWTIAVLVAVSGAGAWLVKREGLATLRRAQVQMSNGRVPGTELIDAVLIVFAGALLVTPGFLTDVLGILLLVPPVRVALRSVARKRLARRLDVIEIETL
ncbi:MAG TPA: FxsA family protein [Acidimicrobiales bacterium]